METFLQFSCVYNFNDTSNKLFKYGANVTCKGHSVEPSNLRALNTAAVAVNLFLFIYIVFTQRQDFILILGNGLKRRCGRYCGTGARVEFRR